MDVPLYIVIGRSSDCDIVVKDPSVSGRHARVSWRGDRIRIEDLGSANGTYVDGKKVRRAELRPGAEVTLGSAALRWSDPRFKLFLRRGARGDTLVGVRIPGRRFICGSCGARGVMPPGFTKGQLKCGSCSVELNVGKPARSGGRWLGSFALIATIALIAGGVFWMMREGASADSLRRAAERLGLRNEDDDQAPAASPQERSIRSRIAPRVTAALDPTSEITRNEAVRIAALAEGTFRIEQVARIWSHTREHWRYVNDPNGDEFFARASQTIENDYAGDCDDFAIVLSAMTESIGGRTRIVMLDGDQGGHAYTEVCIDEPAEDVARRLSTHYRQNWDRYLGREPLSNIHFRSSPTCQVWLNLDWNARVPGGPYGHEFWAVAIYPDGHTETLAPSSGPADANAAAEAEAVRASALPGAGE